MSVMIVLSPGASRVLVRSHRPVRWHGLSLLHVGCRWLAVLDLLVDLYVGEVDYASLPSSTAEIPCAMVDLHATRM